MNYNGSGGPYHGNWPQQPYAQNGQSYGDGANGYPSQGRQAYQQTGIGTAHYQYQSGSGAGGQHPYAAHHTSRASHGLGTTGLSSAYPSSSPTGGYPGEYHSATYHAAAQYAQPAQIIPNTQQSAVAYGSHGVMHSQVVASPVSYANPQLPLAPRGATSIDVRYSSTDSWPASVSSISGPPTAHPSTPGRSTTGGAECVVPCPYNCGTVLTGVHAVGNMTRHLKSQNCTASGKDKTRYVCPVQGCDKRYIRSDGLKVHLRKRHNISQSSDRNSESEYDNDGYE